MGFLEKPDPCPICGGKVKMLISYQVDGQNICWDCTCKMALDKDVLKLMSVQDFKNHLTYREENRETLASLNADRSITASRHTLIIDDKKRLFTIQSGDDDNSPVFRFDEFRGYTLKSILKVYERWNTSEPPFIHEPAAQKLGSKIIGLLSSGTQSDHFYVILQLENKYLHDYKAIDALFRASIPCDKHLAKYTVLNEIYKLLDMLMTIH